MPLAACAACPDSADFRMIVNNSADGDERGGRRRVASNPAPLLSALHEPPQDGVIAA